MRAFGIFTAFAAFTAVFAAPLAAPAPATGNSITVKARDGTVSASIAGTVLDLQTHVGGSVSRIRAYHPPLPLTSLYRYKLQYDVTSNTSPESILDTAGPTPDLGTIVTDLTPCLEQLVTDLTGAAGKAAMDALGNLFHVGNSDANMTLEQLGAILKSIEQDIVDILCKVATLIGPSYPGVAATIQTIM
jgi:hypothetical protein